MDFIGRVDRHLKLYADHGTSEQFHSEIKSDMDMERLPSGKFETNQVILHLGALAYNILRIIGQQSIKGSDAPLKNKALRPTDPDSDPEFD